MSVRTIHNAVPTPEEMAEFLGINSERVSAVRSIMEAPLKSESTSSPLSYRRISRRSSAKKGAAKKATKR